MTHEISCSARNHALAQFLPIKEKQPAEFTEQRVIFGQECGSGLFFLSHTKAHVKKERACRLMCYIIQEKKICHCG